MYLANNHRALVDVALEASKARRTFGTEYAAAFSAAVDRGVIGEIINLSAQFAAIRDAMMLDRMEFLANGTIEADKYL